jgi:hypothetical protein
MRSRGKEAFSNELQIEKARDASAAGLQRR